MVERQEVLRLSFLPGKDRPVQMIRQSSEANFRFRELSSTQGREEAIEELAKEIFSEPFDLVQGPLYRVEVLRRSADHHVLVFAIHHAIADGWTLGVFVQDLCIAYVQGLMGLHRGTSTIARLPTPRGAQPNAHSGSRRNWSGALLSGNPISLEAAGSGTRWRDRRPRPVHLIDWFRIFRPIWPMPRGNWPASLAPRSSARCWPRFRSRFLDGQARRTSW